MRIKHQLERLEPMVLHPLHGVPGEIWHRAPAGKWSAAQIVHHLALSVDGAAGELQHRAAEDGAQGRRSKPYQAVMRNLVLGLGRIPPGLRTAFPSVPDDRPDPELVVAQFRMGVERLRAMDETWPEERKLGIYALHPVLGDLNFPEWVRFHFLHCRHHANQIRERVNSAPR